ncbi:tetratricopeptide repeat protein, partial [bacterium]|nr:tetratricopeptide repeat protein [bacterium]
MISRYYKVTFTIWVLFTIFSFSVFSYFAYYPQSILLVEAYQPGASYERAKHYLNNGNIAGAIKAYQRGVNYFKQLYDESGLERHKLYAGQGLLGIAGIYRNVIKPPDLDAAAQYYEKALAWHPYWDKPKPYLFLGETLLEAGKFEDAISPLTSVINLGTAPNSMEALYLRGIAYFQSGEYQQAAVDWRNYLRFSWGPVPTERWNQFLALRAKSVNTPEYFYVQGLERYSREEPGESIEFLSKYLKENPDDAATKYYLSMLNKKGNDSGYGARPFS